MLFLISSLLKTEIFQSTKEREHMLKYVENSVQK